MKDYYYYVSYPLAAAAGAAVGYFVSWIIGRTKTWVNTQQK